MLSTIGTVIRVVKSTLDGGSTFVNHLANSFQSLIKALTGRRIQKTLRRADKDAGKCLSLNHVKCVALKNLKDIT
jgi:hypothetical protein